MSDPTGGGESDEWFRAQGIVASELRGRTSRRLRITTVHEVARFAIEETLSEEERRKPGRVARKSAVVRAPRELEALVESAPLREEPTAPSEAPREVVDLVEPTVQRWSAVAPVSGWRLLHARDRIAVLNGPWGESALVALNAGRLVDHRRRRFEWLLLVGAITSFVLALGGLQLAHSTAIMIASLALLVGGGIALGIWVARRPATRSEHLRAMGGPLKEREELRTGYTDPSEPLSGWKLRRMVRDAEDDSSG